MQVNSRRAAMLANHEQKTTVQKHLNSSVSATEDLKKDYKLAMYFHNFLYGKSNKLPSYEFLDKVISTNSKNTNLEVISIAYGLSVFLFNSRQLHIENVDCISKGVNRIDKITSHSHDAYILDWSGHIEDLDLEEFPMFEPQKVLYLQKYLLQYQINSPNSLENDHDTSKAKK